MPQVIEVGDRLAHGEEALLQVELAAEQHRHARRPRSAARLRRRRARRSSASRAAWCARSCATRSGDAAERQAVRRQHQRVVGQRRRTRRANRGSARADRRRARPATRLTLVVIRGSSMSPEISTPRVGRVERRVLGRMAVAGNDPPRRCRRRRPMSPPIMPPERRRQLGHAARDSDCRAPRARRTCSSATCRARRNSAQVSASA